MKELFNNSLDIIKMFFGGVLIGIAGFAYLAVGGPVGAFLFSFGLIGIYAYQLILFTGVVGAYEISGPRFLWLLMVLALNICGAVVISAVASISPLNLVDKVLPILSSRLETDVATMFLLSILCGFIVDMAVSAWKKNKNILPTFLGVMVFVSCGFPHCIADAFYIGLGLISKVIEGEVALIILLKYVTGVVVGNFIGCSLRKWFSLAR